MQSMSLTAAVCAAGLAMAAPSAVAQTPSGTPPRCEAGQGRAAEQALARVDTDSFPFHLGKLAACFAGEPPGPPL